MIRALIKLTGLISYCIRTFWTLLLTIKHRISWVESFVWWVHLNFQDFSMCSGCFLVKLFEIINICGPLMMNIQNSYAKLRNIPLNSILFRNRRAFLKFLNKQSPCLWCNCCENLNFIKPLCDSKRSHF